MGRAGCFAHLVDGLSLLAAVREGLMSSHEVQVASNVAFAYARKAAAEVESLLSREPLIHWETVNHWKNVFSEFERAGFSLPQDVAQSRSKLFMRDAERVIKLLSPSERKELLDRLQALDRESGS